MIMQINGKDAGQTVPHVHFHIIPRRAGEPLRLHAAQVAPADRLRAYAKSILQCLKEDRAAASDAPLTRIDA
jgi:histidine triad (HIT) family protein